MEGIYSHTAQRRDGGQGRWIRGRAGVSRAQLKRENRALLKDGLIRKITRRGKNDAHAATEFIPDWLAIRAALEEHELLTPAPKPQPLFSQRTGNTPLALPEPTPWLPQSQALAPPEPTPWLPQSHTVVDVPVVESTVSESRARDRAAGQAPDTHSLSNEEEPKPSTPAGDVAAAIEAAYGRPLRPNDTIPGQVLAIGQRVGVPTAALCRFIADAARGWSDKNYQITSPRLFLTATAQDLIPWARANRDIIGRAAMDEEREAYRAQCATTTTELPAAAAQPQPSLCPQCQQEALIDGTCHSNECVNQREHERTAHRRAAQGS
jgi:hypothetical protein